MIEFANKTRGITDYELRSERYRPTLVLKSIGESDRLSTEAILSGFT
jgi:hypothetical protein